MNSKSNNASLSRRQFGVKTSGLMAAAIAGSTLGLPQAIAKQAGGKKRIPLGFDNFSIRAKQWKADQLLDFAIEQNLDSLLMSDLDVYEGFESAYLRELRAKADDSSVQIHVGTGSICPTAKRWNDKWGSPKQLLEKGITVAKQLGSPVFRCYLGGQDDRKTDGGIEKHIETTVQVLKSVRSRAIDANVKIAVENHAGDMQAWELVELINGAGKEFVGATIDSGNATWTLEHPQTNLETLGPYAVSSGMRDSTVWNVDNGCRVAWNAVGQGQVDWKQYAEAFAELCPHVPFQLEIISGFNRLFPYRESEFWNMFPKAKAADYERFLQLARTGKPVPQGNANDPEFQMKELVESIRYCKQELNMGLKT